MIKTYQELIEEENARLAPYAVHSDQTEGRVYPEKTDIFRLPFQRDRDRVIHCRAFRRLQAKTQVFISYFGDHYRDRMTHSIEVAQIARGIARTLGLNEDLAEVIALAHDLGHTPFGHSGEFALNRIMSQYGSHFEHNEQSRRIIEKLERIYPQFDGLNLSIEVLDGLLKHSTEISPHLEAQVADIADEIAYTNHDMDDGLRSGFIKREQISDFSLWRNAEKDAIDLYGKAILKKDEEVKRRYFSRVISRMINRMIAEVQETSDKNIAENKIDSVEKVRNFKGRLIGFNSDSKAQRMELRKFLLNEFYNHPDVQKQMEKGEKIIADLFTYYINNIDELPSRYASLVRNGEKDFIVVKDYIAGMTDNFAEKKHETLNLH